MQIIQTISSFLSQSKTFSFLFDYQFEEQFERNVIDLEFEAVRVRLFDGLQNLIAQRLAQQTLQKRKK
jgi:hypothetical protein